MSDTAGRQTLQGIVFVNIATITWATNIIMGRYLRAEIGPFALTAVRYGFAAVVFALLLRRRSLEERRPGTDLVPLVAMAVTGILLFGPLLYFGLRYTTAVNATLITGTGPLLTAFFAAVLTHEPYSRRQLLGAVPAVIGVAVLITGASVSTVLSLGVNPGDLVILAAVVIWGLYSLAGRRATRTRSPLSATALSTFMGLPVLVLAAVIEQWSVPVVFSLRLLLIVVYLGVVPAALGFSLWNAGVKKLGAGGAMVFYNTLPLYGAVLGFLVLGEPLGIAHLLGGALIVGGGVFSTLSLSRNQTRKRSPKG